MSLAWPDSEVCREKDEIGIQPSGKWEDEDVDADSVRGSESTDNTE